MRIPIDGDAVIRAARDAGITLFDTARAYEGSEALLGRVLAGDAGVEIVTKCGMKHDPSLTGRAAWRPDGRATAILDDARASVAALGRPIDVLLLHAPDPDVPFATSVRALVRAREEGLARAVGVSNVSRKHLEEAAAMTPLAAVEVALGAYDDEAARGGVVAWCAANGVRVLAHSPLGGPKRAPRLAHDPHLRAIAEAHDIDEAGVVIAYLLSLDAPVVPLVGARRIETVEKAARAAKVRLSDQERAALDARFPGLRRPATTVVVDGKREVVVLMGIAGAGKSRLAESWAERGYERLNRDTIGGTLRGLAQRLDERLASGVDRLVLDNTYITRASRADVLRVAAKHGAAVRCVHVATSPADAQINVVTRMLDRYGELLGPAEMKTHGKKDPNLLVPTALFRMIRELEAPAADEGFASIEVLPFRREIPGGLRPGSALAFDVLGRGDVLAGIPRDHPLLVFAWQPPAGASAEVAALAEREERSIDFVACTHGEGPPVCWCRPPLPGAWLWFAKRRGVGTAGSVLYGSAAAHRTMATALGLQFVDASS